MAFPTTGVLDNFSTDMSAWTVLVGGASVSSGRCVGDVGGQNRIARTTPTYGPDSEAYVGVPVKGSNGDWFNLFVRMTTLVNSTFDGYCLAIDYGTTDSWNIQEMLNGDFTNLPGGPVALDFTAGDQIGIEIIGSAIKGYRNGGTAVISASDGTYASAGYIGGDIALSTQRWDDFGGGTYTAGGATPTPMQMMMGIGT